MKRFMNLLSSKSKRDHRARQLRPAFDLLEQRNLLTAPYVDLAGVLTIDGTLWADTVSVRFLSLGGKYRVRMENVVEGVATYDFDAPSVTGILFHGFGSDDNFTNKTSRPCTAFGGGGNDTEYAFEAPDSDPLNDIEKFERYE